MERKKYKKEENMNAKRCLCCNGVMKYKGPKNAVGTIYWKCRKCGRTTDFKKDPPKEVIPLTYISKVRFYG